VCASPDVAASGASEIPVALPQAGSGLSRLNGTVFDSHDLSRLGNFAV